MGVDHAMKTILLRAPVLTQSGYGVHSRQIARWLMDLEKKGDLKLSVEALPWGDTPWAINQDKFDGLAGELMRRSVPPTENKYDVSIQLQLPNEWNPNLARYNVGVTAAVETDRCNPSWVADCNKMNKIIVPSNHTKLALTNTGNVLSQIDVIPESYPENFKNGTTTELDLKLETSFNFLVFGQVTGNNPENDRKNLFYTVKWMCEALKDYKDVGIIIKTNGGRNTRIDRRIMHQLFTQLLSEVRPGPTPKIYLVHGEMSDVEVYSLLKHPTVKAMVSLTRGEGFGLPLMEAAAAGLPVIATNWSAHTEFLNLGKWIQVDYKLSELHESRIDNHIFMKGARWAQPNEGDFKRKLQKFYVSSATPREWARDLRETILTEFSSEKIGSLYSESLKGVI